MGQTNEIGDVTPKRQLPTELVICEPTIPKKTPKFAFGFGWFVAHGFSEATKHRSFGGSPLGSHALVDRTPLIRPSGTFSLKGRREA